ncbi:vesicular integral-membrane protein VIP36-like [Xenia sp. Carnegie-2017]|uniref:vesicular integral-membrane protein VIP36-like n=1 Tax=Xenia sp. Carnegie-2017 TaxID=2897299 RepID=UPI001F04708B|nr:vesicular integral-membrane protein VIP36-like [Xenia sp. Carnegie-2017]
MANRCGQIFIRNVLFFSLFCHSFSSIYGLELASSNGYVRREHSLSKPFQVGSTSLQFWDFGGDTLITSNHIRLTEDHQSQKGFIWNTLPVTARDWEIHIHFSVHGSGDSLYGDGFAFHYAKEKMEFGPVFGSKNFFSGLAVFFDTYSNANGDNAADHPYISAMVNNGTLNYDHNRDGAYSQIQGCSASFRNNGAETYALIQYLGSKETLTVMTDIDSDGEWKACLQVSGIRLPTSYFIGLSAATGNLADNHDIVGLKFYELEVEKDEQTVRSTENTDDIVPFVKAEPVKEPVENSPKGHYTRRMTKAFTWFSGFWWSVSLFVWSDFCIQEATGGCTQTIFLTK